MKTVILEHTRIERILKRIAYQILEHCFAEKGITLIGIEPRGVWVATQLEQHLAEISSFEVYKASMDIEKQSKADSLEQHIKGRSVILVDDVLNSGHTMMMAAAFIAQHDPKLLITACLVDRKHRRFPIKSDFTGLSLATTLQEHISLEFKPKPTIYLQ
ncbi:MAG: phosphoribosyltransferase family protein [Salibacteraceae bacterium]